MEEKPVYYDKRAGFWKDHFKRAQNYGEYLAASDTEKARRWAEMAKKIPPLTEEQRKRVAGFKRILNVLVYSGVWCGDCVRQGPMLHMIASACGENIHLRVIDRDASQELKDELRILGAMRVPVIVFLTEDFFEVGRFGDRLLATYRAKAQKELGATCETGLVPPPPDQLAAELAEWVDIVERMLLMARLSPPLRQRHGD